MFYCTRISPPDQIPFKNGIEVIAEGIETEKDLKICREIGIDLVQGYLIASDLKKRAKETSGSVIIRDRRSPEPQKRG